MTNHCKLSRNPEVLYSKIEGESVLMSVANGSYYKLSEVATCIWELLQEPATASDVVAHLTEQYEVSRERCTEEVMHFLDQLVQSGLVDAS